MRIASNKVVDVIRFFRQELKGIYEEGEIETFIALCFEEFLGIPRVELSLKQNGTMSESELLKFNDAVKQLKQHRPIQYILGAADFMGIRLKVNEYVLIPRPETEELVDWIGNDHWASGEEFRILDIGTGSGCIAIGLKSLLPGAVIFALDVSKKALEVARENAASNELEIHFIHADIMKDEVAVPELDIIVSNPPYIRYAEKEKMSKNVVDHEPHPALFVPDDDALVFYKAISGFAQRKLKPGGYLFFEINEAFGQDVKNLLEKNGFLEVTVRKDLSGKDRMVRAKFNV